MGLAKTRRKLDDDMPRVTPSYALDDMPRVTLSYALDYVSVFFINPQVLRFVNKGKRPL